ncbi:unnamed protein product [Orchesella dallaii]|uniref:Erythronolide synthase, modules 3 and 4 n=1 Tax=Orchesella dallaii TaxID=48710 RepID=A0ABP1R6W0_9HEXA
MRGVEAWVTTVVEDKSVANALVLANSLRRTFTKKKIVVLASPTLETKNRKLLTSTFDQVFCLDPYAVNGWIGLKDYAKLECLKLTLFGKCVYLDPEVLVLKNCDEIFDDYGEEFHAVVQSNGVPDTSVFCFIPSSNLFDELVATGKKKYDMKEQVSFDGYMKDWLINQKGFGKLDDKYNHLVSLNLASAEEFSIAKLPNEISDELFKSGFPCFDGLMESAVLKYWKKVYEEDVLSNTNKLDSGSTTISPQISPELLDAVAIVGISCRQPGANNLDEFWNLLIHGHEGIRKVPSDRWTKEHGCKTDSSHQSTTGGFLNFPIDEFDSKFFGISRTEMEFLDCQQRLLLEVTYEALENAAINPISLRGTHIGVFTGAWTYDYKDLLVQSNHEEFYRTYMGNSFGAGAARLSHFLGLTGPSVSTESGCSSAMVAVDLACKSLRSGETPLALACGVNLLLNPFSKDTMSFVVAGDGRCKTFDESADGFGRAEGCGVLVLKRYSDAVKDGDNVWALIRGSSCVQEGVSKSMGTPTVHCESLAMSLALKDANVKPNDVSYVEAHGTGTSLGDPLEISAITQVYGNNRIEPLVIGSVKTNVGHTESCSGITGIIKVVTSLQNETIPAHLNLKKLNPKINLHAIPAQIPMNALPWPKNNRKPRLAGVSSFGITGTDGHLIMQDTPEGISCPKLNFDMERPTHIMKLSAKTEEALEALLIQYQNFLEDEAQKKELNFADIAHTANTGRASFSHRVILTAKNCADAKKMIQSKKYLKNEAPEGQSEKVCFLFTGQGSQYVGMSKQLYDTSPVFRMNFDKCNKIFQEQFKLNLKEAIWGSPSTAQLSKSLYSQTAIFCVEYALLKLWESWGIKPDYVLGHSLGEFAAAVAANILSMEDAVKLVAERSRLVESLPSGKMLVVKADKDTVERVLKDYSISHPDFWLDYAALNSNDQTVLAGASEDVELFAAFCSLRRQIKTHILDASHAFHSRLMNPILEKYRKVAETIKGAKSSTTEASCSYISGVYGKLVSNIKDLLAPQYWVDHTREKVNFIEACNAAAAEGCKYFVEIGPQPILSALVMENSSGGGSGLPTCLPSLRRSEENWKTVFGTLSKLYLNGWMVNWKGVDKFYSRSKLRLPTYPFQRKKFWFNTQNMNGANAFVNSNQIHPLLGCIFHNASGSKLFQVGIDLKKVEYIKDHVVGKRVIFPGAGYLEMCLAAGHTATEGLTDTFCRPSGPLTIENLKISAPLAIDEKQICQMQVVMDSKYDTATGENASGGIKVEVYKQQYMDGEAPKWTQHAISYFTPAPVNYDELRFRETYNYTKIKESCQTQVPISDLYGKLAESGLKFGPHFQSLTKIWKGKCGVLADAKIPSDFRNYVMHPVLLDAMLQAAMVVQSKGQPISTLHVPISIKKFTWLENTESDHFSIYSAFTSDSDEGDMISVLFDGNGKIIAFMSGMEFVETSVQAMESLLESQDNQLPPMQNEVWKPQLGVNQSRVNIWEDVFKKEMFIPEMQDVFFGGANYMSKKDSEREYLFEQLCYGYTLNGYYELGWNPSVGQQFHIDKLMGDLQILPQHRRLVRYHIKVFEREGIVQFISDFQFKVVSVPPSPIEVHQLLQKTRKKFQEHENVNIGIALYTSCGAKFASILKGKDSALNILFPQDPSLPSVEGFYTEAYSYSKLDQLCIKRLEKFIIESASSAGILRILEVGAGTGNFTGGILKMCRDHNLNFEYTFTDISPAFFINAEKKFEEFKDVLKYRVLNVEEDAKSQGFCPGYFDFIFGADVIHATKDLSESISNLRQLLRPKGLLSLVEGAKENYITTVFGLLEGYWRFTDLNIRQHHPLVNGETWRNLCLSSGFDQAVAVPCSEYYYAFVLARASEKEEKIQRHVTFSQTGNWLVFAEADEVSKHILHKLSMYRPVIHVRKSNTFEQNDNGTVFGINVNKPENMAKLFACVKGQQFGDAKLEGIIYLWGLTGGKLDQADISQPFLNLCQAVVEMKQVKIPKMLAVTKGVYPIGDHVCENPASSTIWGIGKSFANEYNTRVRLIDLAPDQDPIQSAEETFSEIWNDDVEQLVAYRENVRYYQRLMRTKITEKALKLPQSDRFQLVLPQTKAISDLKFGTLGKFLLKSNEVEICVKAAALNFRDVFAVLKPDKQFENINCVGSDFAGIVSNIGSNVTKWKVGDHVFGCNLESGALPSHVRTVEDAIVRKPKNFTFGECATLPAVFATAYYSLITVAKMQKGETILIHTASGGVGLSAIQIAQELGVKIIATAGSCRKRAYLRNLGIDHVFHSRNTNYEKEIMKVTGGKGVDIVLNSLTGPGFKEASLNVCSRNARFIEMSKLSIWQPEEAKLLRSDVEYTIVDLTSVGLEVWSMLFAKLDELMKGEKVKSIPYVRFDGVHIREALTYLQKAKHIGKIVCVMPQVKFQGGHYTAETPLFNEESTYMVTGGLGGIGFEVVKWMASNEGAKNLIIVSRSYPKENHMQAIKQLRANGVNVIARSVDVGDYATCKRFIESIEHPSSGLPPLRGIMHCAGVLSDATLMNQSWEKFLSTFRPKIKGTWNLHELTKHCNLEHFVMFSSMAATFGPPGQSNHAAGNAYLDALANCRDSMGLTALTINWGQWSTVGIAAGKEVRGVFPFSPQRGIAALGATMRSRWTQIGIVDLDYGILCKVFPQSKHLAQTMIGASSESSFITSVSSDKFWEDVDSAKDEDKAPVIKKYIKLLLKQILKLDDEDPIDDHSNFQDLGLDSLMMIELKNNLQTILGGRMVIGPTALADCNNIDDLTERLLKQMNEDGSSSSDSDMEKSPEEKLSPEELIKLIKEDSILPETVGAVKGQPIMKLSHAKTYLLTGITGNLGPHILKELLKYSQIETIYCLMRKTSNPLQRLKKILTDTKTIENIDLKKVKIIVGDLGTPNFGLADAEYDSLAQEIDAVIHCAVKSNHIESYGMNSMRKVNVFGTLYVLEFCSHLKTKHLFHSSSIVAVASTDQEGALSENWPTVDELEGVTDLGYPVSKMICDRLVQQSVLRGLPCKAFRFGGLIGHSKSGTFRHYNNHLMLRFLCYMKLGAMPSVPVPAILLPVDLSANVALKIFFDEENAPFDIYNLCHPTPALEQEFPLLAKEFGYEVDVVDYNEFVNRFEREGEDSLLYPFKGLYENEDRYNNLMAFPDAIRKWLEHPDKFFSVKKVSKVIPEYVDSLQSTWDYVRRDLLYARETGLFQKFKLAT